MQYTRLRECNTRLYATTIKSLDVKRECWLTVSASTDFNNYNDNNNNMHFNSRLH